MTPEPRPELARIRPVVHGATLDAGVIDFSVSTNPLGPSPAVLDALRRVDPWRYPDPTAAPLRRALGAALDLDPDQIIAGNGSAELIWLLALAYGRPAPESVLIAGPTFGEYARAAQVAGAAVHTQDAATGDGFRPDVAGLARRVRAERPRLVWLCNPNNPTGVYLRRPEVEQVLEACAAAGALLVVDEAYLTYVQQPDSLLPLLRCGHLCLLRSMTKDFALAGLRLGYGAGPRPVVDALRTVQPPWSVNAAAQACGLAALSDTASMERARREVWAARAQLGAGLKRLGLRVTPPTANFVLVEVGDGAAFRARLLPHGLVVRDCASFGLPRHVRLGVRLPHECARLLAALEGYGDAVPEEESRGAGPTATHGK